MKRSFLFLLLALAACDREQGMELRTYELARLQNDEAVSLITPYVTDGGRVSASSRLLTVRERPERLELIEELLKKYDGGGEAVDVVLRFQVIEANGFAGRDTAIADIEQTLRQMFKYRGYRLVGEQMIQVREEGRFDQRNGQFRITGGARRVRTTQGVQSLPLELHLQMNGVEISSTVTATIGKPVVLGQSTENGAVILVVRPALAGT